MLAVVQVVVSAGIGCQGFDTTRRPNKGTGRVVAVTGEADKVLAHSGKCGLSGVDGVYDPGNIFQRSVLAQRIQEFVCPLRQVHFLDDAQHILSHSGKVLCHTFFAVSEFSWCPFAGT